MDGFLAVITSGILVEVRKVEPATFDGDGLVVPTNSYGLMSEGVAEKVRLAAGEDVQIEASRSAPIAVGAAVVTGGGKLDVSYLIHVPVVEHPGMRIGIENVRRATRASLLAADHYQMEQIGIPGIGYGENGIPYDETARAILDEIRAFRGDNPKAVVLLDTDPTMISSFRQMTDDK